MLYMTMIVSMLILVYKKANNLGYKLAMFQLFYQLDDIYGEMLVERLGGDPALSFDNFLIYRLILTKPIQTKHVFFTQ